MSSRFHPVLKFGAVALAVSLSLGMVACSDDEDDPDTSAVATATEADAGETPEATATSDTGATGATGSTGGTGAGDEETVEITAVDYEFEGLPETVEAGTTFTMMNDSEDEAHEVVAIRLPDSETRSVEELLELPEEELGELASIEPSMVLVAAPGEEAEAVLGDGTLTEPGRYLFACFIPVGADPEEVTGAMEAPTGASGPPELAGGPPHFTEGMYAEVTVE